MINYLVGKVTYIGTKFLLLESNWVGYYIHINNPEMYELNKNKRIFIHKTMKLNNKNEIIHNYYGFVDFASKCMFDWLQNVPNIGPKTALTILKNNVQDLIYYIQTNNVQQLINLPGISEVMAKNICNQLNKITAFSDMKPVRNETSERHMGFDIKELQEALKSLGYDKEAITQSVHALWKQKDANLQDISEALSWCIKNMHQKNEIMPMLDNKNSKEILSDVDK